MKTIFARRNRTSEDEKNFFCSSPTFAGENRTSEGVKNILLALYRYFQRRTRHLRTKRLFFCSSPIFSRKSTNCRLARGKNWPLISTDFDTQTEKGCPSLLSLAHENALPSHGNAVFDELNESSYTPIFQTIINSTKCINFIATNMAMANFGKKSLKPKFP